MFNFLGAVPKANPAASLAGTIDGKDKLSPEAVARIEANKEAARKRKAAMLLAIKNFIPTPTVATEPLAKDQAPPTAPRGGGLPEISNRRCKETKGRGADGHNGPTCSLSSPTHQRPTLSRPRFSIDESVVGFTHCGKSLKCDIEPRAPPGIEAL